MGKEQYKAYCPIQVNGYTTHALVDSGNSVGNAMSWDFAQKLGLRKEDLEEDPQFQQVNTAKQGAALQVLGKPKRKLRLQLGMLPTKFSCKPFIIKGLSMAFNLSGPFMKKHHIDQLHSQQAIRIQRKHIPLTMAKDHNDKEVMAKIEPVESAVYVARNITVPKGTAAFVPVRVPAVASGQVSPGEGLLEAQAHFVSHTDVNPALSVLDCVDPHGIAAVSVMNTSDEDITIQEGQRYGTFRKQPLLTPAPAPKPSNNNTIRDKKWYVEQFKLNESPFLQKQEDLDEAVKLLQEYDDLFSHNDNYGHTNLVEHAIYTEDKPPIKCRHRPINPSLEPTLKTQLRHWLDQDVIEPSSSPWSFPLVAVPKKNGKIRFVIDYRGLNKLTIKDSFPLPNIEDNLARLANSKIFSGIDGTGAYHVVSVRPQDREKTAFSTPWGLFHFKRMPFGLANAPATYCRLVQKVLDGIPMSIAVPYLDDCAIHSRNLQEHLQGLHMVLQAHREAGLTLQPEKCQLFKDKIEYLGHEISEQGIAIPPNYTKIVDEWPIPKTIRDVRTFLGKVSYYRRFIPRFSEIASPLTDLTKDPEREEEFEFNSQALSAFQQLKAALSSAQILAYPRFDSSEPFVVDTDWSGDPGAIGGVLSQVQDGEERVIAYGARKLNPAERAYSSHKGELLAAIFFMRHWKYYLQHRPFILRTDHEALKWIHSIEEPKGMIMRWLETLANYEFKVEFRRGKKHGNADALSRTEHAEPLELSGMMDQEIAALEENEDEERNRPDNLPRMPEKIGDMKILEYQEEDEVMKKVKKWITTGQWPTKPEKQTLSNEEKAYAALEGQLHVNEQGIIERRDPLGLKVNTNRPCIPDRLKAPLLLQSHQEGGHRGGINTYEQFIRRFYFPGAASEAMLVVKLCHQCQKNQPKPKGQHNTLASTPVGDAFCKWSIDFVGPLPTSRYGHSYILTAKDCFTRWVEAFPTENMTAQTVARTLEKEIFSRYGIPEQIHSDQGTQFTSQLMQEVYKELGILGTTTPAYNPKSNPVERTHRDLGKLLRGCVEDHPQDWEDFLPGCLLAMRTARNQGTGFSPFAMVYGREAALPLDLLYGQPYLKQQAVIPYVNKLRARLNVVFKLAREQQNLAIQRSRRLYQEKQEGGPLKVDDLVWLYTPKAGSTSRKLALHWTGPWQITQVLSPVLYRVKSGTWNVNQVEVTAGLDRLRRYHGRGEPPADQLRVQARDVDLADEFIELNEDSGVAGPELEPVGPAGPGNQPPPLGPPLLQGGFGPPPPPPQFPPQPPPELEIQGDLNDQVMENDDEERELPAVEMREVQEEQHELPMENRNEVEMMPEEEQIPERAQTIDDRNEEQKADNAMPDPTVKTSPNTPSLSDPKRETQGGDSNRADTSTPIPTEDKVSQSRDRVISHPPASPASSGPFFGFSADDINAERRKTLSTTSSDAFEKLDRQTRLMTLEKELLERLNQERREKKKQEREERDDPDWEPVSAAERIAAARLRRRTTDAAQLHTATSTENNDNKRGRKNDGNKKLDLDLSTDSFGQLPYSFRTSAIPELRGAEGLGVNEATIKAKDARPPGTVSQQPEQQKEEEPGAPPGPPPWTPAQGTGARPKVVPQDKLPKSHPPLSTSGSESGKPGSERSRSTVHDARDQAHARLRTRSAARKTSTGGQLGRTASLRQTGGRSGVALPQGALQHRAQSQSELRPQTPPTGLKEEPQDEPGGSHHDPPWVLPINRRRDRPISWSSHGSSLKPLPPGRRRISSKERRRDEQ